MFPFGKREKTSTTTTTNPFLGSKFQPFLFVRGQKVVGWQWGIEFTLREFYSIQTPQLTDLSGFILSHLSGLKLIPLKARFQSHPDGIIILKYTNRSKFHKPNG